MKKFLSILLAFLILISNVGIAMGTHFCGGKAVESKLMFHQKDLHCGMAKKQMVCNDHSEEEMLVKSACCENDFLDLEVDDNYNYHQSTILKLDPVIAFAFTISFLHLFGDVNAINTNYPPYKSPPLVRPFQSLFQVFIL